MIVDENIKERKVYTVKDLQKAAKNRDDAKYSANFSFAVGAANALVCFGCIFGISDLMNVDNKSFIELLGQLSHYSIGIISGVASVGLFKNSEYYNNKYQLHSSEVKGITKELNKQKKEQERIETQKIVEEFKGRSL